MGTWGVGPFDNDAAAVELRELWDEAANPAWLTAVHDLRYRLGDALAP